MENKRRYPSSGSKDTELQEAARIKAHIRWMLVRLAETQSKQPKERKNASSAE